MPSAIASPEILAFAAGFPLALLHAVTTLAILVAGAKLASAVVLAAAVAG